MKTRLTSRYLRLSFAALLAVIPSSPGRPVQAQEAEASRPEAEEAREKKPKSQRWEVSWGVDAGAARVRSRPTRTSIAHLLQFKRPKDLPGTGDIPVHYRTHRIAGVETVVWTVTGTIMNVTYERDGDYRLILGNSKGAVLTCVLPDPARAPKRGRFSAQIDAARAVVARKLHPAATPRNVRVPARITGLGYFGRFNSDANKSPEGFQLHPVFSVRFLGR
jgi:hypothetical protein